MDILVMVGLAAIGAVIVIGTAIKIYTNSRLKQLEGTYDEKKG